MRLLLDTRLLLLAASQPDRLSATALRLIRDPENSLFFSTASIWEVSIRSAAGRADFRADSRRLRRGLLENGYEEVPVTSEHAVTISALPAHNADPFDLMLVAQAMVDDLVLVTADAKLTGYPGSIRHV